MALVTIGDKSFEVWGVMKLNKDVPPEQILYTVRHDGADELFIKDDDSGDIFFAVDKGGNIDDFADPENIGQKVRFFLPSSQRVISGRLIGVDAEANTAWEGAVSGWYKIPLIGGGIVATSLSFYDKLFQSTKSSSGNIVTSIIIDGFIKGVTNLIGKLIVRTVGLAALAGGVAATGYTAIAAEANDINPDQPMSIAKFED